MGRFIVKRRIQLIKENKWLEENEIIELKDEDAKCLVQLGILMSLDTKKHWSSE